jgi:glycerophosphoryl diester phosphodiesterase
VTARPLVVAHRGGRGLGPENTLGACRIALGLRVDAVEVDVRLTADGVPVALHDATLERTTTGRGPVGARTFASLGQLDATLSFPDWTGGRESPPALGAVLALLQGRAAAHVELKGDPVVDSTLVESVVRLLHSLPAQPAPLLLSFDWAALRTARALAPEVATGALVARWPVAGAAVVDRLAAEGVSWLGVRYALLTRARVAAIRAAGLRVGAWTVNHPRALRRALALGLDAITTDRPDRLLRLLASLGEGSVE